MFSRLHFKNVYPSPGQQMLALCRARHYTGRFEKPPSYTLLLACNRKGRALLSAFKRNARISVYTKGAQVPCALAARADALYTLSLERRRDAGAILRKSPFLCE